MNHFVDSNESKATNPKLEPNARNRIKGHLGKSSQTSFEADSRTSQVKGITARLLERAVKKIGDLPVRIRLPDGQQILFPNVPPLGTFSIRDWRSVLALATDPLYQFGETYMNGKLEIDGDMAECLTAIYRLMHLRSRQSFSQRIWDGLRVPAATSRSASKQNVHHHYNLGNDFYRLWLDEQMLYTCAYFTEACVTLEQAQVAKMEHVCRKLRLKPGMDVVEAGCGWGALALHMAKHYGVRVRAFNVSSEQIIWAREAARRQSFGAQVEFVQDDWRNIIGKCDAFVSVGMLEHVGLKNYTTLGQTILRTLKPNGLGLIHTIGQNQPLPFNSWIERRIFPGAYAPTLKQMMEIFEPGNFQVLDVENLRLHYAETLRRWLERFENSRHIVRQTFDDRFVRMWRMYLAGSVAAFESGYLQLYQVVFAHGSTNNIPRTREYLYRPDFELRGDL